MRRTLSARRKRSPTASNSPRRRFRRARERRQRPRRPAPRNQCLREEAVYNFGESVDIGLMNACQEPLMVFGCAQGTGKYVGRWVCIDSEPRGEHLRHRAINASAAATAGNAADIRTYTYRDSFAVTRAPNSQYWWVACADADDDAAPMARSGRGPSAGKTRASTRKRAARSRSRARTNLLHAHVDDEDLAVLAGTQASRELTAAAVAGDERQRQCVVAGRERGSRHDAPLARMRRELDAGRQIHGQLDFVERGPRREYQVDRARLVDRELDSRCLERAARARALHVQARQHHCEDREGKRAQEGEPDDTLRSSRLGALPVVSGRGIGRRRCHGRSASAVRSATIRTRPRTPG